MLKGLKEPTIQIDVVDQIFAFNDVSEDLV